jgi:hypothetical protein
MPIRNSAPLSTETLRPPIFYKSLDVVCVEFCDSSGEFNGAAIPVLWVLSLDTKVRES